MKSFTFHNPGKLIFGNKAVKKLGAELLALGVRRPFLITDEGLAQTEIVEAVKKPLAAGLVGVFTGVTPDTGIEIIDQAAEIARKAGADSVVSVGGGSSMDTAKAVAAMLGAGAASVRELIGFYTLTKKPLPHVAIPTTAGTGSECTSMAVIKDRAAGKKLLIVDQKLIPDVGILDPLLTLGLPPKLTAATGMDAMTHAAESIMSLNAMPPADALALHAISLIAKNLPQAVAHGDDLEARSLMLIASAEAAQAFQNAFVGAVHAMAHALGGMFDVPHGLANGMLLAAGMEYNAAVVPDKVAMIGAAMGVAAAGQPGEDADRAVTAMRELCRRIGIPPRLSEVGVKAEGLPAASVLAMADAAMFTNPRKPADAAEIEALLRKLL